MWQGTYYDGLTSNAHAVDITVHGAQLLFTGPVSGNWALADLAAMPRFDADDEYVLTNRNYANARLIVPPALYDNVLRHGAKPLRVYEGFTFGVFAKCLVALVAFVAFAWVFLKVAPPVLARYIPPEMENRLGADVLAGFTRLYPVCENKAATASLQRIADRITADNGLTRPVTVKIINYRQANAFALPGGTIVFTTGALRDLKTESQIAGVMAHEQAHVQARHNLQGVLKHMGFSAVAMVLFGHDGAVAKLGDVGAWLAMMSHSRSMESEADALASGYLDTTGYGRKSLAEALDTMLTPIESKVGKLAGGEKNRSALEYIQSHPGTDARIAALNSGDTGTQARTPRLLRTADLRTIKTACASVTKKPGPLERDRALNR